MFIRSPARFPSAHPGRAELAALQLILPTRRVSAVAPIALASPAVTQGDAAAAPGEHAQGGAHSSAAAAAHAAARRQLLSESRAVLVRDNADKGRAKRAAAAARCAAMTAAKRAKRA